MSPPRTLALGCLLAAALTCAAVSAQSPNALSQPPSPVYPLGVYQPAPVGFGGGQPQAQAAQLAQQYVKAEKEDQKKDIRKKLADVLSQEFDHHSQQQQKELEELEKQIASLRSVLKKRLDAKATIVERRVEQLVQDAEGLGWNAPHTPRPGFSSGLGGARMMPPGAAPISNRPATAPKLPESPR